MIMLKPELYQNTNGLSKKDTVACLEKYAKKMKQNPDEAIIDIGCGDGGTTGVVLKKYIPHNFKKLVGCDKSEVMVNFANQVHSDQRTSFILLDIEEELPEELKGNFNRAFSFFLINWIRDLELAFSNIYNLLTDGGECLQLLFGQFPVYDIFVTLSGQNKWSSYLCGIKNFLPVYYNSKDPIKLFTDIMEKTGFKNVEVRLVNTTFTYQEEEDFKKAIEAVNPFEMPSAVQEEFLIDFVRVAKQIKGVNTDGGVILLSYEVIETYGTK